MKTTEDIPRVSVSEPLFTGNPPSCTRTWEAKGDPELSNGQIVDVGGTACNVIGKVSGKNLVTYRFSPVNPE